MGKQEILDKLRSAVESGDPQLAEASAREALDAGIDPYEAIISGLAAGMNTISEGFDKGEIFLPQIMLAADAMNSGTAILQSRMDTSQLEKTMMGVVVIGTPQGDIHEIGKNLVGTMLRGAGFNVIDIGRDVPLEIFVKTAKESKANIVAASTLMSTSRPLQKELIDALEEENIRSNVKTLHGGAPVTKEYVDEISGDGYAPDAAEAVTTAKMLLGK